MAKLPGFGKRGNVWHYRVRIPTDLVEKMGRKEVLVSLRTSDRQTGQERYWQEAAKWRDHFAEQRRRRDILQAPAKSAYPPISEDQALALSRQYHRRMLERLNKGTTYTDFTPDQRDDILGEIGGRLDSLETTSDDGGEGGILLCQAAQSLQSEETPFALPHAHLSRYLRRAIIDLTKRELAHFSGDYRRFEGDELFSDTTSPIVVGKPKSVNTMKEVSERFWAEQIAPEITSSKTVAKYQAALAQVVAYFDPQADVATISRQDCKDFRATLAKVPSNFTKRFGKKATLREIAADPAAEPLPKMAFETQGTYLNMMVRLFAWCRDEKLIEDDIARKLKPNARKQRNEDKRRSFTKKELEAIFSSPTYTGCVDDERGFAKPGPRIIKRSRFWVPLIALFTGMRLGEILQLTPSHVRTSDKGTQFFSLSADMQLKTENGIREVPLHSTLIEAGFVQFVEAARSAKRDYLFDDVPIASDGHRSSLFSKRFAYFLKVNGLKEHSPKNCFHMFRHTLRDGLRRGDVPEEQAEAICGWSRSAKTSRSYGSGFEADTLKP